MKNLCGFCLIFIFAPICAGQTGDGFTITQSVISSGGQRSANGGFIVDGTAGQTTAGTNSAGGNFNLRGGFRAGGAFVPTAAPASISGRVFSGKGAGIVRRVQIRLFDPANGVERTTQTNYYGEYRFDDLEVGQVYIVRAESRNYIFTPDQHFLNLLEDRENINFTGSRTIFLQLPN